MCACGSKESLAGTWKTEVDITSFVTDGIGLAESFGLEEDFTMESNLVVPLNLELKEDGTCTLSLDKEGFSASADAFFAELIDIVVEATYKMAEDNGMTREQMDEMSDGDLKTYIQALFDSMDLEGMLAEEDLNKSGAWKAEDGKLYLADSADELGEATANAYQLDGSKLTLELTDSDMLDLSGVGYEGSTLVFEKK